MSGFLRKNSTLAAAAVMALVFVAMFAALPMAADVVRLAGPAVLALLAGFGTKLMLARTPAQITDDAYHDDALGQKQACLDLVDELRRAVRPVKAREMHERIDQIAQVVPELLSRVERTAPTSLYSSSAQLRGHLESLLGVLRTFADIERNPRFYPEPQRQLEQGQQAVRRFEQFSLESIQLVNQGDLASYQANLATVAPPEMPRLGGPDPSGGSATTRPALEDR